MNERFVEVSTVTGYRIRGYVADSKPMMCRVVC